MYTESIQEIQKTQEKVKRSRKRVLEVPQREMDNINLDIHK